MPDLTAAPLRAGQYTYRGYVSTPPQTVVLAGTLSATPTYPTLTLAYTVDSGVEADVKDDMTVVLFASDGTTIKGVLRVAAGGAVSGTLQIAELSAGTADMASGDKFEVRDTYLIWDKLVAANDAFDKDSRTAYTDQGSVLPPFANSGGPRAAIAEYYFNKVLALNPIAYWRLNELTGTNAVDSSGNGFDGTTTGAVVAQPGIGDGGRSYLFDGSGDFVNVHSDEFAQAFNGDEGTVVAWAKVADWEDGATGRIFRFAVDSSNEIIIWKHVVNNRLIFRYEAGGVALDTAVSSVTTTDFFQVVITWSKRDDAVHYYLQGVELAAGSPRTGLGVWVGDLNAVFTVVAASSTTPTSVFNGNIPHVAVLDRPLTPAEIADLYIITDPTLYTMAGSTSFTVDPDSGGGLTHLWTLPTGVEFQDGSVATDADPVLEAVAGFHRIEYQVTDTSNSEVALKQIPLWAHNRPEPGVTANIPISVIAAALQGGLTEGGYTMQLALPIAAEADILNLPDGSLIVYWEEEFYGGVEQSYGSEITGQSHVKHVGYLIRDTIEINAETGEVSFEVIDLAGMLAKTPALPQLLIRDVSPTAWPDIKDLTSNIVLWYMLYWHTTLAQIHDVDLSSELNLKVQRLAVTDISSFMGQLLDVAQSFNLRVASDRGGRLVFRKDPAFLTAGERSARTIVWNFTTADFMSADITSEHRAALKMIRGEGITVNGTSVYSVAPGKAPGPMGTGIGTLGRQIVADQDEMNVRTGLAMAKENSLHDGVPVPRSVQLTIPDGYDVFDFALGDFITLTIPATSNDRGRAWTTATLWTIDGVDIAYDHEAGAKEITLTISHETDGVDGVKDEPPFSGLPAYDDWDMQFPGLDDFPELQDSGLYTLNRQIGNLAVIAQKGSFDVEIFTCIWGPNPTWQQETINGANPNRAASVEMQGHVDAYSPAYVGGSPAVVNVKLIGDQEIWGIYDIFGVDTGPTAVNEKTLARSHEAVSIATERGFKDYWMAIGYDFAVSDSNNGTYLYETIDGGTTWTIVQVDDDVRNFTNEFANRQATYVSRKKFGRIYWSELNAGVSGEFMFRWRDGMPAGGPGTDEGTNIWKHNPPPLHGSTPSCGWIEFPVHNNEDEEFFYWGTDDDVTSLSRIYRADHGVVTDITLDIGGVKYGPRTRRSIVSSPLNRNKILLIGLNDSSETGPNCVIASSENAGTTWTILHGPLPVADLPYDGAYIAGDDGNVVYLIGATTIVNDVALGYSTDFCRTIEDRSGNLSALGAKRVVMIAGG